MTNPSTTILILGGGYAGVMAALRLAYRTRRLNRTITLINASAHFVERCRLHEAATGMALRKRPLVGMLRGSGVQFQQGWVTRLDPTHQVVTVRTDQGEEQLPYNYLINALGSRTNHFMPCSSMGQVRRCSCSMWWRGASWRHWPVNCVTSTGECDTLTSIQLSRLALVVTLATNACTAVCNSGGRRITNGQSSKQR